MSLYGLIRQWPAKFYAQTWYQGEPFMDTPEPNADELPETVYLAPATEPPGFHEAQSLPTAVSLATLYLAYPEHPMWEKYFWTRDMDRQGQRVYVGVNHGLFEIHRHIHITSRFAIAQWA